MNLTEAHKAAAFEWLRYLAERHGEITDRDREQADIALRVWNDAEQRAQRAEAENARLRNALRDFGEYAQNAAQNALATPTPESETAPKRCSHCGTHHMTAASVERCPYAKESAADAHPTPEQTGWYCAHCERGVDPTEVTFSEAHEACGRIITDDSPPKQNGDALAALDDETLLRLIRETGVKGQTFTRTKDGIELDYPNAEIARFAEAVRHLTASGVPEQTKGPLTWADESIVDQFLNRDFEVTSYPDTDTVPDGWPEEWDEKPFARIRWAEDSGDPEAGMPGWSGFCLTEDQSGTVLGDLITGGVPYVPEEVRQLPSGFREAARICRDPNFGPNEQMAKGLEKAADQAERALASAPAVPESPIEGPMPLVEAYHAACHRLAELGESHVPLQVPTDYKLVPVEPTEEMLEAAVSREIYDEIVGDGNRRNEAWTQYKAMIAAAPQRGGE